MTLDTIYTIILIGNNDFLKTKLQDAKFSIKIFKNQDDFKIYYQDNSIYIDLILDNFSNEIRTSLNGEAISCINENNIIDQITDIIKTKVKEIDFSQDLALSMLDNNQAIYNKLLVRYIEEYKDLEDIIMNLLVKNDYLQIREYVHKIKGISLNVGSDKLYQISRELEYKIMLNEVKEEDVKIFVYYNNRILNYSKEKVGNV